MQSENMTNRLSEESHSLSDYYSNNKQKYNHYNFTSFLNQDKFNSIFVKILQEKDKHNAFIFVDHDCDGISSGLIISEVFTNLGIKHFLYIHDRHNPYGINEDVIAEYFMKDDYTIFISADLGITNAAEVTFLRDNWNPIIIISDHHLLQENKYPHDADVVINPKLSIEKTAEFVCGAGVVHQLFKPYFENQFIKIVSGIACCGDMVPLLPCSLNRNIVIETLRILNTEKIENPQLRFFFEQTYDWGKKYFSETDISFSIVPLINSLSRYYIQDTIKDYFSCNHGYNRIYGIIKENNDRRKVDQKKLEEEALGESYNSDINVIVLETKQHSLLGIAASCVMNAINKPIIMLAKTSYGYSGSGRSTSALNIFELFSKLPSEWFINWGGHAGALGTSIKDCYFEIFKRTIDKITIPKIKDNIPIKINQYEYEYLLFPIIKEFAPFGQENPSPKFLLENLIVEKIRYIREHCFITASYNGDQFSNVLFEVCYFKYKIKLKKHEIFSAIGTFDQNKTFFADKIFQ